MSATRNKFSPEFRDRAVRMVDEHRGDYPSEWAAMSWRPPRTCSAEGPVMILSSCQGVSGDEGIGTVWDR